MGWDILRPVADVDLSIYDSIEALESLGMVFIASLYAWRRYGAVQVLIDAIGIEMRVWMNILELSDFSGSLKDRANRLWTAKTVSRADLPLNLFATSFKGKKLTIVFFSIFVEILV